MFPPMSSNPSAGRPGTPRPVQTTVDLTGLHRKALEALAREMLPGEVVRVVILGERDQAIIGTARRAFVFKKGAAGGALFTAEMISWDYAHLTGVQTNLGGKAGAVVLEASSHVGRSRRLRGQHERDPFKAPNAIPVAPPFDAAASGAQSLRTLIAAANSTASTSAPLSAPSPSQELQHLAELRDLGVITPEEFEIMKARIVHGG
jgi:hypothetical protein